MQKNRGNFNQNEQDTDPEIISKVDKDTDQSLREFMGKMVIKHNTWRQRYFPGVIEQEIIETQKNLITQSGKQLLRNNEVMGEMIFQSLVNVGNNMIQREAGWLESDGQDQFIKSHITLRDSLKSFKKKFNDEIKEDFSELSNFTNERQRELNEKAILFEMEKTIEMIQNVLVSHLRHAFRPLS